MNNECKAAHTLRVKRWGRVLAKRIGRWTQNDAAGGKRYGLQAAGCGLRALADGVGLKRGGGRSARTATNEWVGAEVAATV
jgi:hypothetical protein